MTSSSSNTQTSTPSPTSWKYRNDGIWEYNTQTQMQNIEKTFNVSIDAEEFKKAVGGNKFSDGTLYTVFDKNCDGALSLDELRAVVKPTTPAPTPAPTTTWNYGRGDTTWEYNTETQIKNIEKVLNVSIDADNFKKAVGGDVFSDGTLYTVFDTNDDGALSVDELSTVIKSPTPPPTTSNKIDLANYGKDKKYNYSLEEFAEALRTKSNTEIDRTKLRDRFTIFNDQKNISDDDIYFHLDTNGDLKLSDSEISSFVNSVKKTTPGTTDVVLEEINDMKQQINDIMQQMNDMMQQMGEMLNMIIRMQQPTTKPMPTFPNNMMPPRFPAGPFGIMPYSFGTQSLDASSFPSFGASAPYNAGNTGGTSLADMMKSLQQLTQTTR